MAEYIEREEALAECDWYANEFCEAEYAIMPIRGAIRNIPSADVQPVRHGRWIQHYEPYDTGEEWIEAPYGFECSECGRWEAEKEPFCNCGALMKVNADVPTTD